MLAHRRAEWQEFTVCSRWAPGFYGMAASQQSTHMIMQRPLAATTWKVVPDGDPHTFQPVTARKSFIQLLREE